MNVAAPPPQRNMGAPVPRLDARKKVTGEARYPSDHAPANLAYAFLVTSAIAKGRIARIDLAAARAVPGVLDILTYETADRIEPAKFFSKGGTASTTVPPLSQTIFHDGQIVAMAVADSFEAAREAAYKIAVRYDAETPSATFDSPGTETVAAADASPRHEDPAVGDAEAALAAAAVAIDAEYSTPTQHHNPMELFTTTCAWTDDRLTVYEPSQFVHGLKHGVAQQLGIDPAKVRVLSAFVGGAFGSKGTVTPRTVLVAMAARRIGRPVKLVLTRDQGFTVATYRAETRHRVRLGAGADGRLAAYAHEGWEISSRPDDYFVGGTESTVRMYAAPNVWSKVSIVHADRNTPGFMRSPPEVPYMYALESAMDELAVKLAMDPVELRRVNDTMTDPITGAPYTSRSLMACFDAAAQAFGWAQRDPVPGSMRDGDWLIGWGCATATYPTQMSPAAVRVRLGRDGAVHVELAAHEIGTGAYTVIGQMATERLGTRMDAVDVALGDSDLPPGPIAGGSMTTASACSAVMKACDAIRDKLFAAVRGANDGPLAGRAAADMRLAEGLVQAADGAAEPLAGVFDRLGVAVIEDYAEWIPDGAKPDSVQKLYRGGLTLVGGAKGERMRFAFGAEFVELRIHARTREIRAPRLVGAFAAGRIMNTRTARSQLMGGLIWGLSSALHEETEIDRGAARYVNDNIAEYLVPVNADVGAVEVILIPEEDPLANPAGVKGLGELGNVGTAAAVANAVYHATGRRIRKLPIRIEDLL
jgi:xanthine dehydrogenase YagR molybdenum-binding subunit